MKVGKIRKGKTKGISYAKFYTFTSILYWKVKFDLDLEVVEQLYNFIKKRKPTNSK